MSSDCHRAWHLLAEASQQTSAVESDVSPERGRWAVRSRRHVGGPKPSRMSAIHLIQRCTCDVWSLLLLHGLSLTFSTKETQTGIEIEWLNSKWLAQTSERFYACGTWVFRQWFRIPRRNSSPECSSDNAYMYTRDKFFLDRKPFRTRDKLIRV